MRWPCIPRRAGAGGAQRLRALVAPESRSVIPIRRRWLCGPASAANPARLDAQLIPPPFLRCREKAESAPTLPPFAIPRCSSLQYQKMLPARWVREIAYNLLKPLGNSKAINWLSLLSMKISLQIENCREPGRRDRQTVLPVTASSARQSGLCARGLSARRSDANWRSGASLESEGADADRLHNGESRANGEVLSC